MIGNIFFLPKEIFSFEFMSRHIYFHLFKTDHHEANLILQSCALKLMNQNRLFDWVVLVIMLKQLKHYRPNVSRLFGVALNVAK